MGQHDRYDNDILKQLTRIANSLEALEKIASYINEKEKNNGHDNK